MKFRIHHFLVTGILGIIFATVFIVTVSIVVTFLMEGKIGQPSADWIMRIAVYTLWVAPIFAWTKYMQTISASVISADGLICLILTLLLGGLLFWFCGAIAVPLLKTHFVAPEPVILGKFWEATTIGVGLSTLLFWGAKELWNELLIMRLFDLGLFDFIIWSVQSFVAGIIGEEILMRKNLT